MNSSELYNFLDLPEEVKQNLSEYGINRKDTFRITVSDLMKDNELVQNLDKLILSDVGEDPDGIKILWEELKLAEQAFEEYQRKGISFDIFIDTMKFCTRFLSAYYKSYGCYRFVWGWWFPRQLSLKEFRIGALEYEYSEEGCIYVHIPSDADLSPQSVFNSISRFKDFNRQYFPEHQGREIRCQSWLLSPELKNVLTENSNILAFQKLFDVVETDYESMAVLDWVFPGFDKVSEELPEETSLQKKMKKHLLGGGKIGWSTGKLSPL